MKPLSVFSPAKLNLFLAVTGRRADGFHELVSLVTPLDFGDELILESRAGEAYSLECDQAEVPLDSTNLVLRAAALFAEATGKSSGVHFRLRKRVPIGAGLGGGSSNGTAALLGLNQLHGGLLTLARLAEIAAKLGSDCALFLRRAPCVMRGRGEQIETVPDSAVSRLRGRRVLLFKPSFGIATAWAYRRMAAEAPASYMRAENAESQIGTWLRSSSPAENLLTNNMEGVAFGKYLALPTMLESLRKRFSVAAGMSGSGSACFALLPETMPAEPLVGTIQDGWGNDTFVVEARIG